MKNVCDELKRVAKSAGLNCYYEELYHHGQLIGTWGYNGVRITHLNYTHNEEVHGAHTVVTIYEINPIEPQVPLE